MKKRTLAIITSAAIVIIGLVAGIYAFNNSSTTTTSTTTKSPSTRIVKAREVFTLSDAQTLLGDNVTAGDSTEPATTESISVDSASYDNNATIVADIRIISIMVRTALDNDGKDSNAEAFKPGGAANPSGAIAVSGYGEKAFWDPSLHELAILKENVWIGIVYGGTNPTNNTLEDAKKVADLVITHI